MKFLNRSQGGFDRMSKLLVLSVAVLLSLGFAATQAPPGPRVGADAPDFKLSDAHGKTYKLSDFRGQKVVLEIFRSGGW